MKLTPPVERIALESRPNLNKKYRFFKKLIEEINMRDIPERLIALFNKEIQNINSIPSEDKKFTRELGKKKNFILKTLEKELKLVPRNYYRNQWMVLGMTVFGLPMGIVFGTALGNMAFLGIGLPIGMVIGLGVGNGMDDKAKNEGRQLNIEYTS